jgi:iron complex outermembrane receptor protein
MNLSTLAKGMLCICLAFFSYVASAQTKVITGKVTDAKDGSGLSGVSVLGTGGASKAGSQTTADGSFKITVPAGTTKLVFTIIGYAKQEVSLGGQTSVSVALKATSEQLNDVVVIGYGTARKKDITGAVASVQAKDFNQGAIASPDQLLQNKVAGVEITQNNGQPGSATTVKIRGNNSIRVAANPLYVVDGVPLDGRSARPNPGTPALGGFSPDANPLLYINPNDIQSIDVLKDASSAAIYGSRGANGVIVITTKTGSSGAVRIDAGASYALNAGLIKRPDILNTGDFKSALAKYGVTGEDYGSSVDALKAVKNSDLMQNYNLAMSGGNENGKFRASLLASNTEGYLQSSNLNKYVGNFSGQYKLLDKRLTLSFNVTTGHTTEHVAPIGSQSGSVGNIMSSILQWNPTQAFTDANGNYVYPANGAGNPLAWTAANSDIVSVNTVLGNISAAYKILPNLEYKFLYAVNNSVGSRNTNLYGFLQGVSGVSGLGYGAISNAALTSQTFDHTLNYKTDLTQKLHLDAVVGFEYWKSNYSNNSFSATQFNTNQSQNSVTLPYTSMLQDGNVQALPSIYIDPTTELQSEFGRVQFNYDDKYFLTGTVRNDGSSKFGSNNKYGVFPSIGFKWAIINEDFMKESKLFSNLGFRATWGITGNQEFPAGSSQEQFGFSSYNTAGQNNVANPNLKWEQTGSYDLGLDFALKNGRVWGTFDYYNKNTTNILFQNSAIQPAPATSYFINLPANLMNTGFELSLGFNVIHHKDFNWDLTGYYSHNKNELKNFTSNGAAIQILTGAITGQGVSGTLAQTITNNMPIDEYWLKPFQGYTAGAQNIGANPQFAGDPNPHSNYGISTTLNYKKWALTINGGGAGGYLIYNNNATNVTNISGITGGRNIDKNAYNSPELPSSGVGASTRFLESGNFFKIRNSSLSYTIGNAGKYVKNLRAFVTGNNLLVFTKYSGFDPEVNVDKTSGNYPSRSIDYLPYPTSRTVAVGVNFSL